jgi:uncharacterized protein YkvS
MSAIGWCLSRSQKAAHVLNLQLSFFSCVSPTECFCYYDLYPMKIKSKKKVRPSGKFQAQLYFDGRYRHIGVFDSKFEAATVYEMIRRKLKEAKDEAEANAIAKANAVDTSSWSVEEQKSYEQWRNNNCIPTTTSYTGYKAIGQLYQNGMIGEFFRHLDEKLDIVLEKSDKNIHQSKEVPYFSDKGGLHRKARAGQVCNANHDNYYQIHMKIDKIVTFPNGETLVVSCIQANSICVHIAIMFRDVYERHKKGQKLTVVERCWFDLIIKCTDFKDEKFVWEVSHLDHDPENCALNNLIVEKHRRNSDRRVNCFRYISCTECKSISRFLECKCDPPCKKLAKNICMDCDDTPIPDALRRTVASTSRDTSRGCPKQIVNIWNWV